MNIAITGASGFIGKRLLARRGEFLERTFAHCYETGGLRRLYVQGDANITKRLLLQAVVVQYRVFRQHDLADRVGEVDAQWNEAKE